MARPEKAHVPNILHTLLFFGVRLCDFAFGAAFHQYLSPKISFILASYLIFP